MDRLMMRYLLIFHCEITDQWRCLDSARVPGFVSGRIEDLPVALNGAGGVTLPWMLGRRQFGPLCPLPDLAADAEWIAVHALDPGRPVIGASNEYHGAWLEIFLQQSKPNGWIAARRPARAMAALEARTEDPLRAHAGACRPTLERMRAHQQALRDRRDAPVRAG